LAKNNYLCRVKTKRCYKFLWMILALGLLTESCSVSRFVPEGEYLLDKVVIQSDSAALKPGPFSPYVRQHPNGRWFNLWRVPLLPYMLSTTDSTKSWNRFMWRIGENPVIADTFQAEQCRKDIQAAVRGLGYLDADVELKQIHKKCKTTMHYQIHPGTRYKLEDVYHEYLDTLASNLVRKHEDETLLKKGMDFDLNVLDAERTRINKLLQNNGFYHFNKEFLRYEADTTQAAHLGSVSLILDPYRTSQNPQARQHQQYRFGYVEYLFNNDEIPLRPSVLERATHIYEGKLYSEQAVQNTYASLGMLDAVLATNITLRPDPADSLILNSTVSIATNKPNSISAELEGTNSAGDLGAAVSASFSNRNLLRGSEVLSLKLRGAFEAIKGLDGYDDQNYIEYSAEASLRFPDFMMPFLNKEFRRTAKATSELSVMWDSQDRPEFHRRVVTAAWRYRWNSMNGRLRHRVDMLDLNYVFMPWISETFRRDYLDDPSSRNAILRYNYENLFIMKWGYNFSYSSRANGLSSSTYGTDAYSIRFNVESSGNLLRALSSLTRTDRDEEGHFKVFNIAYAQYAKFDFDFAKSFRVNDRNSVALHFGLGVALPYGNSNILPYEKRYFSGGANSVRGWSVRELGPGSFKGNDGRIDFINQTGDLKLDMNAEYRTHLFWKVDGAVFADAGNIWTLRNYEDQPGGQFRFDTCWEQIALSYGLGIRLNVDYFIVRLDGGMKAINPAYSDARHHYPIIHPNLGRDFTFHFAVGLPF